MKRRYDYIYGIILILILVIAYFISSAIFKGILLLLFAAVLIVSTLLKLKMKWNDKFRNKLFLGILLFLEFLLAASSVFVIVNAVIKA